MIRAYRRHASSNGFDRSSSTSLKIWMSVGGVVGLPVKRSLLEEAESLRSLMRRAFRIEPFGMVYGNSTILIRFHRIADGGAGAGESHAPKNNLD
jgi:hypothetical protein